MFSSFHHLLFMFSLISFLSSFHLFPLMFSPPSFHLFSHPCPFMYPFLSSHLSLSSFFLSFPLTHSDTANKIGTYQLAITAKYHGVPFFAAVPTTTLDLTMTNGSLIHVEERPACELTRYVRACICKYMHVCAQFIYIYLFCYT